MKIGICFLIAINSLGVVWAQPEPRPSNGPSKTQLAQIGRKYGMFIHFGINTFCDEEWTDGARPPSIYRPTIIDADQWIATAKAAGMKYVILVTKHEDGFCLWDSKYTDYDVGSSGNRTNVVKAVARACRKYGLSLGLYYSLWDRHLNPDPSDTSLDKAYNTYLIAQLKELIAITRQYTPIVELWLDAGWEKARSRWPIEAIYSTVKGLEPQCQ